MSQGSCYSLNYFCRDRKKKKFVNDDQSDPKKKKIKTESGAWISASYKTDLYKKWKEQNKTQDEDEDGEDNDDREETRRRDKELEKMFRKNSKNKKSPKSELKSKADLLKQRMQQDKKRKFMEWRRREKSKKKSNK